MSEAPKRLYLRSHASYVDTTWYHELIGSAGTEYIRADLVDGMRETLESIAGLADTYVVCNPGQCRDCDLLADIGKTATAALEAGKVDG